MPIEHVVAAAVIVSDIETKISYHCMGQRSGSLNSHCLDTKSHHSLARGWTSNKMQNCAIKFF